MSNDITQSLARAFELIEADEHAQAREIVEPIVEQDPDNADAWWIYVHAVSDRAEAQRGLDNLRRIDQDYPGLGDLERDLNMDADLNSESDYEYDDFFEDDFPGTTPDEQGKKSGRSRLLRILLPIIVVVVLIVLLVLVLSGGGDDDGDNNVAAEPTAVPTEITIGVPETPEVSPEADSPTSIPEVTEAAAPTDMLINETTPEVSPEVTETSEIEPAIGVGDVLASFALRPGNAVSTQGTELGQTLVVAICVSGNDDGRETIDNALLALSSSEDVVFDDGSEAVAINMINCDTGEPINTIAVEISEISQANTGDISETDYRQRWQAIEF